MGERVTRVIALANQKGGVGKTTTCVNLGAAFLERGFKVLLVDNDPQGNMSSYLAREKGGAPVQEKSTLDELYLSKRAPEKVEAKDRFVDSIQVGFDLIRSDAALMGVEHYLYSRPHPEGVLKKNLEWASGEYDFVLIDNPPSMGLLTMNALVAAHEVLVPLQAEFFSLEGVAKMKEAIGLVRERWNNGLVIAGVVPTIVDQRKKLTLEVIAKLREYFPQELLKARIRDNSKLSESSGRGVSIFQYAPSSSGAQDYRDLATELVGG